MKNKLHIFLLLTFANLSTFAQTEVSSKIQAVKVYKQNAQISRTGSFSTKVGTQEIVLTGISTLIVPSSLQIQFSNSNAVLLSAKYENNYLQSKVNNKNAEAFQTQLDDLIDQQATITDKRNSLNGMLEILAKNQDLGGGNASFTPQQVVELSNVYEAKYLDIQKNLRALEKREQPIKEQISKLSKQLAEMNARFNKPSGNIILQVSSTTASSVTIDCKYIVNNAGWTPLYDLRSKGITENVQLSYNANIYQNTGVDWEDASIIVSTGNPSQNNNRPILNPLYAGFYQERNFEDKDGELNEVVVTRSLGYKAAGIQVDRATVSENQLSIDFNISGKQTILSDGKENLVALKNYDMTTEYIYHTVPKLDKSVFLIAKISDWTNYNLIPGKANIFFEGAFVGTSQINPAVTADSLMISMGLDNSIVVERTPIKEFTSSKFIGSNAKQTFGYDLVVKNKKSVPIKIEILDQIPVSQEKGIQVELEEKGSAEYTSDIGKLLWTLTVPGGQSKKERFIYSVKYPKQSQVIGIK
ncbi:MAG: mucoidy inhibitor MuiA family protein [Flavobacterium sp.]